jgi:hypothetical protein
MGGTRHVVAMHECKLPPLLMVVDSSCSAVSHMHVTAQIDCSSYALYAQCPLRISHSSRKPWMHGDLSFSIDSWLKICSSIISNLLAGAVIKLDLMAKNDGLCTMPSGMLLLVDGIVFSIYFQI